MVALPPRQHGTRDAIYAAYAARQDDSKRYHLGASMIGRECERQLWYSFRWAKTVQHEGRLLRLFDTGHLEEPRMVADLRAIGCTVLEVDPENGRQWTVRDDGGHFGGSMDGVALGLPEAPKTWHLLEFKTHNEKSFNKLCEKGVQQAKLEHYAQMQAYMELAGLTRALYMAKNKNTDDLYCERVYHDAAYAMRILEKARRIIASPVPPPKAFAKGYYLCRWCDFEDICHNSERPERNCRTCMHSTPVDGGQWECATGKGSGNEKEHLPCHRFIPDLVPLEQTDVQGDNVVYDGWTDDGT